MKMIQVFEYKDMPADLADKFIKDYVPDYDEYVRFFPNDITADSEKEVVEWLLKDGMIKEDHPFFYVLINCCW